MTIDFYEALSLERDDDVQTVQARLQNLRAGYGARAARAGEEGEQARQRLELIAQAQEVFRDETSREEYDLALARAARQGDVETPTVDWLTKGWDYYYAGDIGAAEVAVARARQHDSDDPRTYVLAAWVEISIASHRSGNMTPEERYRQAKKLADEAMVLDTEDAFTLDVHEVRGAVFGLIGENNRAVASYDRAIQKALGNQLGLLNHRKAAFLPPVEAANVCMTTLIAAGDADDELWGDGLEPATIDLLVNRWCENTDRARPSGEQHSWQSHAEVPWPEAAKFYSDLLIDLGEVRSDWERKTREHVSARLAQVEAGKRLSDEATELSEQGPALEDELTQQWEHRKKLDDGLRSGLLSEPIGWFQFLGGVAVVWAVVFGVISFAGFSWAQGLWWWGVIPLVALPVVLIASTSVWFEKKKTRAAIDQTEARRDALKARLGELREQENECARKLHQPL